MRCPGGLPVIKIVFSLLAAILFTLSFDAGALAQSRVFVAAQGSDSNPCTFAAPCRTFQHAHDVVAGGGEIDVLDPAGYGALTITKSISIQGHGFAGLAVPSGTGITIGSGVTVNLRGLLLDGVGTGNVGIDLSTASVLNIQDSLVRGFALIGISVSPPAGMTSRLFVANTHVTDNLFGIQVNPSGSGAAIGALDHVTVENSTTVNAAVGFFSGAFFTVADSVIVGNSGIGIAVGATGTSVVVSINNCKITNNHSGVEATNNGAIVRLNRSTITLNSSDGFAASAGGIIYSYLDNYIDGNGPNIGSLTTVNKQ